MLKIYVYILALFTIGFVGVHYGAGKGLRRAISPAFYFAIASTYLVAFLTPWPLILLLWTAAMMLVDVRSRLEIACRYVLMLPLMPAITPFLMLGSHVIGQFSPADFAGFGAVAASMMMNRRSPEPPPRGFGAEEITIGLLIVIFGLAAVRMEDVSLLIRTFLSQVMVLAIPFWIIRRNVRTREDMLMVAACFGCAAAILSVLAIYEHHASWVLFDPLGERFTQGGFVARSSMLRGGALRASATLGGPIELGIVLMLGLLGTYNARRFFAVPTVWAGMLALTFVGLLATQSRSALIATIIGGTIVLLVQRRWAAVAGFATVALAGFALLKALAVSSMRVAAFLGEGRQVGVYKDYRTFLLDRGLQEGRKHPWFGTTMDDVIDHMPDLTQGEHIIDLVNSYLHIYLIAGLVGLGGLLIAFLFVYPGLWQKAAAGLRGPGESARAFVLGGLTALLIQLAGVSFYGRTPLILAVLLAAARVIRRTERRYYRPPIRPVLWETGQLGPKARPRPAAAAA